MMSQLALFPFYLLPLCYFFLAWKNRSVHSVFEKSKKIIPIIFILHALTVVVGWTFLAINNASAENGKSAIWDPGFYLSPANLIFFSVVGIVGIVAMRYSITYLHGDPRHGNFIGKIAGLLGGLQLIVLSENLIIVFLGWVITNLFLHQLLSFHIERKRAIQAARKKRILSRLSEIALLGAILIFYKLYGSCMISDIVLPIESTGAPTGMLFSAAIYLLAISVVLQSAQFMFHGWLLEVMESPTPVSALLHAGVIGAGPFLLIILHDLVQAVPTVQIGLFIIGMCSAFYGAFSFIQQKSVKTMLGYSSIAHMGFSLLLCSIGAYSAALLHLCAHSIYKAHAFLRTGSEIENRATLPLLHSGSTYKNYTIAVLLLASFGGCILTFYHQNELPVVMKNTYILVYLGIISLGYFTLTTRTNIVTKVLGLLMVFFTATAFLLLEQMFHFTLYASQPTVYTEIQENMSFVLLAIGALSIVLHHFFPTLLQHLRFTWSIHFKNGLYLQHLTSRFYQK